VAQSTIVNINTLERCFIEFENTHDHAVLIYNQWLRMAFEAEGEWVDEMLVACWVARP
jgi:hypothetical protein